MRRLRGYVLKIRHRVRKERGALGSSDAPTDTETRLRALVGHSVPWKTLFAGFGGALLPEPVSNVGIMGRMTPHSIVRLVEAMALRDDDVLLDLGAGDGGFLAAAAVMGARSAMVGVEADEALVEMAQTKLALVGAPFVAVEHADIRNMRSLGAATVVYSFCDGMRQDVLTHIAKLCRESKRIRLAVFVPRPRQSTDVADLCSEHVDKFGVRMSGGGKQYTAFCYVPRP